MTLFVDEIIAAKKLKQISLTKAFNNVGSNGTKKRIEFLTLLHKSKLFKAVRRYELYDDFQIGERTIDTCFEMHDGDEVVKGLLLNANDDVVLMKSLVSDYGQPLLDEWKAKLLPEAQQSLLN